MSILAQAFLTLVRSHFVSLMLLSVRHNCMVLDCFLTHLCNEGLGRLERGNVVSRNHDGRVLGNVAGGLLRAGLHSKAAEATEIHVLALCHRVLHAIHKTFYNALHLDSLNSGALGDLINDFCLSHNE